MIARFVPAFAALLMLTSAACAPAFARATADEQQSGPAPVETPAVAPVTGTSAGTNGVEHAAAPAVDAAVIDTSKDYRIGPDDVLDIWVFDQRDLIRQVQVRPDGKITLPFVNDIVAAGRTTSELRDIITKGLTKFVTNPEVSVGVKEVRSARVTVTGAVKMPNIYPLRTGATVLEMIAEAQAFTEYADRKNITFIRANGERMKLNYNRMRDGKDPNPVVQPGDIIIVND